MRVLRILTGKQLNAYFLNPFGWVVLAFVVLMQGHSLSSPLEESHGKNRLPSPTSDEPGILADP